MQIYNSSMTNQPLLKFDSKDFKIIYRSYEPADSEQAISLEEEASQHFNLFGMLSGGSIFGGDYDTKCRKFPDHIILLAEAIDNEVPEMKRICACACLGIKDIYFNGKIVKAGILFDLRVSDKFQRRGIGAKLTSMLEETARNKGCEFFYLSVNGRNKKAISLYQKTGYDVISERTIHTKILPKEPIEDRNNMKVVKVNGDMHKYNFQKLSPDQAREHYNNFYKNQDLAVVNFDELLNSREYVGTYAVTCDDNPANRVGLSLFKIDSTNAMGLKRLFAPAHYFTKDWFYSIILAIFLLILYPVIIAIHKRLVASTLPGPAQNILGLLSFFVIAWCCIFVHQKFNKLLIFISKLAPAGRFVGPFYQLENPELMNSMFEFLTQRTKKACSDNHIGTVTMNFDKNDKIFPLITGKLTIRFRTLFMGKYITKRDDVSVKDRQISNVMFFDPRDL